MFQQSLFLRQGWVRPADIQAAFGQRDIGNDWLYAMNIDVDNSRTFNSIGHRFEGNPATGITRHGPAVHTVVEIFLHARRRQYRHHDRFENVFGLMRQRGGTGAMVITGNRQHTAKL
ncbi:hypothetical protein D3C73_1243280 [compost metagenome]